MTEETKAWFRKLRSEVIRGTSSSVLVVFVAPSTFNLLTLAGLQSIAVLLLGSAFYHIFLLAAANRFPNGSGQ